MSSWLKCSGEVQVSPSEDSIIDSWNALEKIAFSVRKQNIPTCVVLHREVSELVGNKASGAIIKEWAYENDFPVVDMEKYMTQASSVLSTFYRDNIHLTEDGQKVLAKGLQSCMNLRKGNERE